MKLLISFLFIFLLTLTSCFSEKFSFNETFYLDYVSELEFNSNGKGVLYFEEKEKIAFNYDVTIVNSLIYITFSDESITDYFCRSRFKKLLVLKGSVIGFDSPYVNNFSFGYMKKSDFPGERCDIINPLKSDRFLGNTNKKFSNVTSYLIEKDKSYKIENLNDYAPDTPWIENAPGDGIGEGFTILDETGHKYSNLLLMNGYISFDKPCLYSQNSRIKKIKITGCNSGVSKIVDVLDTPHPQTVDISFLPEADDIRIEIADVYHGTKYQDTCLNFCQLVDCEIKPKFDKPINSSMK